MGQGTVGEIAKSQTGEMLRGRIRALPVLYPVGAIYLSLTDTDPAMVFGGKWQKIEDRFLLAAGSVAAGTEGGEAEHILTEEEMPSHRHGLADSTLSEGVTLGLSWEQNGGTTMKDYSVTTGGTLYAKESGGGMAHNNMPPYLAVHMWVRIG